MELDNLRVMFKISLPGPRRSMYAIYAYIDSQNHPNVGIYGIHGVSKLGHSGSIDVILAAIDLVAGPG